MQTIVCSTLRNGPVAHLYAGDTDEYVSGVPVLSRPGVRVAPDIRIVCFVKELGRSGHAVVGQVQRVVQDLGWGRISGRKDTNFDTGAIVGTEHTFAVDNAGGVVPHHLCAECFTTESVDLVSEELWGGANTLDIQRVPIDGLFLFDGVRDPTQALLISELSRHAKLCLWMFVKK